ncbi:hypothetical protein ACFQE5_21665 [Pseudonocardia hispaniensis]|uniref:ABC transporter permease n=1 Tax=Pseudonocardia hispaniensis TaxID=904933 RepID=A0ABW1J8I0_9PSEU
MLAVARLLTDGSWVGSWGDATLRATTHLVLLLPMVILAGALDARRVLRPAAHPSAVTGVRPPAAVVASLVAVVALWGLAGYLLVLVTGYAATARVNPVFPPPLPWIWVAAGAAAVVAHAALGVLLGWLVPVLVAVALAGLLGLLGNVVLAAESDSVAALFTVVDSGFLGAAAAPRPIVQGLQAAFYLLLAASAAAVTGWLVRPTGVAAVAAAMVTLLPVGAAMGLAATGGPKAQLLTDVDGTRHCTPDGVVCLWPDHGFLAARYGGVGRRMLAGVPEQLPVRGWTEIGLARRAADAPLYIAGNRPGSVQVAQALADGLIERLAPGRAEVDLRPARAWLAARALEGPARVEVAGYGSPVQALLTRPEAEQWDWFLRTVRPT